jgi:hypothetical protein
MRQGLGYKYVGPARRLSDFVSFMHAGAETITTELAMEWVTKVGKQPTWAIRLTDVRCFAQHLAPFDPATVVPPANAVPIPRRVKPYIYSDAEIEALLAAALALPPADALRRWTYYCLFGLIASARASSASRGWSPFTPPRSLSSGTIRRAGMHIWLRPEAPLSSLPSKEDACCIRTCIASSGSCRGKSAFERRDSVTAHAYMIFAIAAPS